MDTVEDEKPTHSVVMVEASGKRHFHTTTAKNEAEAAIKARLWLVERNITAEVRMIVELGDAGGNARIVFQDDQISNGIYEE